MLGMPKKPKLGNISQSKLERSQGIQESVLLNVKQLSNRVKALESIIRKGLKLDESEYDKLINEELKNIEETGYDVVLQCESCGNNMAKALSHCQFCGAKNNQGSN